MTHLLAFLIFFALAAASWFVSVAVYQAWAGGPDPVAAPGYRVGAATAVGLVAVFSFIPFPAGYIAALVVWGSATFGWLDLPAGRAAVLFALLAAAGLATRLMALGVLSIT